MSETDNLTDFKLGIDLVIKVARRRAASSRTASQMPQFSSLFLATCEFEPVS